METLIGKKVYRCEYCGKVSLGASAMLQHERSCHNNPLNLPQCWNGCCHFVDDNKKIDVVRDTWYDPNGCLQEISGSVHVRYCEVLKCNIFTPLVGKWKREKLSKEGWKQMPSIVEGCEHFRYWMDDTPPLPF